MTDNLMIRSNMMGNMPVNYKSKYYLRHHYQILKGTRKKKRSRHSKDEENAVIAVSAQQHDAAYLVRKETRELQKSTKTSVAGKELFGERPLWEVGFDEMPSRNGASPGCHYQVRHNR